jgi:hypothetical protein
VALLFIQTTAFGSLCHGICDVFTQRGLLEWCDLSGYQKRLFIQIKNVMWKFSVPRVLHSAVIDSMKSYTYQHKPIVESCHQALLPPHPIWPPVGNMAAHEAPVNSIGHSVLTMPKGGDCDMMCELFQFLYRQEPTL